jgi:four helix bundle protein
MKRQTPNAQRRAPNAEVERKRLPNVERPKLNVEWLAVREDEGAYASKIKTFNVQRSTSNAQLKSTHFDLEDRLLEFSARIIRLVDALPNTRAANHVAGQLLRCGTSPLGNHGEVQAAESRRDFVHKLRICLKEFKETRRFVKALPASFSAENGAHSSGNRGAHQNIRCEHPHDRKEWEMSLRFLRLNVERWTLGVER